MKINKWEKNGPGGNRNKTVNRKELSISQESQENISIKQEDKTIEKEDRVSKKKKNNLVIENNF